MTQLTHTTHHNVKFHSVKENLIERFKKAFQLMLLKRRTRKELTSLPDYLLDDLGISREDIHYEMKKSYWLLK